MRGKRESGINRLNGKSTNNDQVRQISDDVEQGPCVSSGRRRFGGQLPNGDGIVGQFVVRFTGRSAKVPEDIQIDALQIDLVRAACQLRNSASSVGPLVHLSTETLQNISLASKMPL